MLGLIIKKIIGSKNDREVKRLRPLVAKINEFEASLQSLPDDALKIVMRGEEKEDQAAAA